MSADDDKTTTGPSDDVKRKFREALERKNKQQRGGEAHLDGRGAVDHAQGNAATKQEFRRKSGG
ncbi:MULTISPECIES: DUF5302 domain-containing protein [Agromyces]|uniref:DUF5302 domain-containing protein n=2 Tax=Agromyces TaxID=33877 RepID=A0A191WGQ7_9MICO|nr:MULTISPECIES: DUF5302 domain-containing protein [Agromyces]ANJ27480.1 hypothetical protein ATC03_12930 [Agromyces aureus]